MIFLGEEILNRFDPLQIVAEPEIVQSSFVCGYSKLMKAYEKSWKIISNSHLNRERKTQQKKAVIIRKSHAAAQLWVSLRQEGWERDIWSSAMSRIYPIIAHTVKDIVGPW